MSTIIGILLLVVLNIFTVISASGLIADYSKSSIDQSSSFMSKQLSVLAKDIYNDGIDHFNMLSVQQRSEKWDDLQKMSSTVDGRIIIIDNRYRIIADTYDLNDGDFYFNTGIMTAFDEAIGSSKEIEDGKLQVIVPVKEADNVIAVVMAISSLNDRSKMVGYLNDKRVTRLAIGFVVSLLLSIALAFFIRFRFHKIQKQLDVIALGHTDDPLPGSRFSEFDDMTASFNHILDRYMELENSRQEFVSNVSHELKTPITSMKILADSLLSMDGVTVEMYKEFMEDITHEIDRESQIISDLLALVKMDKTHANLNIAPANINELLEMLIKRVSPIADKRNITLTLDTFRTVIAEVDESKLSLAINNILDNAVKYNNDGGKVKVYLNADHKFCYIRIRDTGVGIPEDCVDQIFERFYRVDKARSRDAGGTGLGLALTRNIIILHKGSIKVYSKIGEGSTFILRIPLNYVN